MYKVKRTDNEIDELLDKCTDAENDGTTKFSGMTYEQGISAAINWLTGNTDSNPLED